MLCWIILPTISSFGLISASLWLRHRHPSTEQIATIKKRAQGHLALGLWDTAYQELMPLIRDGVSDPEIGVAYAQTLQGLRNLSQALTFIENLEKVHSEHLGLSLEKGRIFLKLGHAGDALDCFERARPILQTEAHLADWAQALFQCGQIDRAWELIQAPVEHSCHAPLLAIAGHCCFAREDYELAQDYYSEAVRLGARERITLLQFAYSLRHTGKLQRAQRIYRQILDHHPDSLTATLGLGVCFEMLGQYDRALMIYQSGKAWDCGNPQILGRAGVCAARTDQEQYAELYLTEAVKRGRESPELLAHLGYTFESQQRWEEAEQVYFRLVEHYPHHVAGYRALSWLYGMGFSKQVSAEAGISMAQKALELRADATSWDLLSACEARAGNFDKAHDIQERLSNRAADQSTRNRRQQAMRRLRRRQPLNEAHVGKVLVA